jgi:acetoin utilization deacetylase AcuC-like enzyme
VIISAGFDAHRRDPLGNLNLVEADFAWATRRLMEIAAAKAASGASSRCWKAATTSMGSSRSVAAHVTALMGG